LRGLLGRLGTPFQTRFSGNSSECDAVSLHHRHDPSSHSLAHRPTVQTGEESERYFLWSSQRGALRRRGASTICCLSHEQQYIADNGGNSPLSHGDRPSCGSNPARAVQTHSGAGAYICSDCHCYFFTLAERYTDHACPALALVLRNYSDCLGRRRPSSKAFNKLYFCGVLAHMAGCRLSVAAAVSEYGNCSNPLLSMESHLGVAERRTERTWCMGSVRRPEERRKGFYRRASHGSVPVDCDCFSSICVA